MKPLDGQALRAIDSLSALGIRDLRLQLDSTCRLRYETDIATLTDSILQVRRKEREALLR